ncbi:MAG: Bax inhibitor-1 family protein [Deltaproteobacteria bacterium]|nr:Bax inhibitor-1 family protein [Deltaproteobacteria bacterium]MDQ3295922.1 Bax inhibitor-1 family protein [Myxococcota bacterium]
MAFAQSTRPIEGAVATLGVSDRVTFLRKTYAHLGVALIAFALIAGGMMRFMPETSLKFSMWALQGSWTWLLVIGLFMVIGVIAQKLANSQTSRGVQYAGLALFVVAEGVILQPLLWVLLLKFGGAAAFTILTQAIIVTLAIFIGLTLTVFLTKKDFSFMRGALVVCSFGALGVIVASMAFGFTLGAVFCGAMILLMAGYILYQTSLVMRDFPPTGYVAASLMLFSTIATLFWYVLQLLMSLRD